ncbi:hypothetical protein CDAR_452941 [Caerostris darwini]|uniref:Uncharacterized protein n=1 Tax=Caerostris darwini TaxID=1538125 RepID=A0AAV4VEL2_9ARAC|nr:hypothetical protein CDAR_452941 [Caerostris darwini]
MVRRKQKNSTAAAVPRRNLKTIPPKRSWTECPLKISPRRRTYPKSRNSKKTIPPEKHPPTRRTLHSRRRGRKRRGRRAGLATVTFPPKVRYAEQSKTQPSSLEAGTGPPGRVKLTCLTTV